MKLKPELLQHPNIPKMLHGLAPRVIKGQDWWNKTRQEAYASTDYHCLACGVHKTQANYHQWLEAHEDYTIDYKKGEMKINKIIPLCHSCHNFIHSGRLSVSGNIEKIIDIVEHGLTILEANDLKAFPYTLHLAKELKINHKCKPCDYGIKSEKDICQNWNEWKLIFEGKEYYSKFNNFDDWKRFYES